MPIVDKPLAELWTYQGLNPRPNDFDEFWDASIAEMEALDPQVELRPASFQAAGIESFHLYLTGVNGSRVHAKYFVPMDLPAPRRVVRVCHANSATPAECWCNRGPESKNNSASPARGLKVEQPALLLVPSRRGALHSCKRKTIYLSRAARQSRPRRNCAPTASAVLPKRC